jgi:NAD(P)-dependent dehydrogenase (short-subunit alcohol dehydrogenase family)
MLRGGFALYGPSKAALEAAMAVLSNDLKGTGISSTVLLPGGITNTPMLGEHDGDRALMLQPEVMVAPLLYVVDAPVGEINGKRFIGVDWDSGLPPGEAAKKAGGPIAWMSIARMPVEQP